MTGRKDTRSDAGRIEMRLQKERAQKIDPDLVSPPFLFKEFLWIQVEGGKIKLYPL